MTWLNPWIVRQGAVSSIERGKPWHALTDMHATTFQIGRDWMRYRGSTLPIIPGDVAIIIGWKTDTGIEACFVVLPDEAKLFRPYRGWSGLVFGVAAIAVAAVYVTGGFVLSALTMMAIGTPLVFQFVAWREGYRLARSHLRRSRPAGHASRKWP